jgi:hypothetical protein
MLGHRCQPRGRRNCVPGELCCQLVAATSKEPRDIGSVECSPELLTPAGPSLMVGALDEPGRSHAATVISNDGGLSVWTPRLRDVCGSNVDPEPGVTALGHLARDSRGRTFVVMRASGSHPWSPIDAASTFVGASEPGSLGV